MAETMQQWLVSGRYLPRAFRDFHDQKDVFKWIGRCVERNGKAGSPPMPNWVQAQIYVIDWFLWLMAKHGYTLQRARKRAGFEYYDIDETIRKMKDEMMAAPHPLLEDTAPSGRGAGGGG